MACPDGATCHHACGEICLRQKQGWLPDPPFAAPDLSTKWDRRFLAMAKLVSSWSKDPSTKFGVVIARPDHTIASLGFNGFPRGCSDADALYANREEKYGRVVHAEVNAILTARERLDGYSLFIWPGGSGPTCDRCAACVIQAGIAEVVYEHDPTAECVGRWGEAMERGLRMYGEAGVQVVRAPLGASGG